MKAHRNEEEVAVFTVVSNNVMIDNDFTLEQRVDRLIAKSNTKSNTNQTPLSISNIGTIVEIMADPHFNLVNDPGKTILNAPREIFDRILESGNQCGRSIWGS